MNGWLVAVWLVGWLLAVRPSMRRTMLQEVCSNCGRTGCDCKVWDSHPEFPDVISLRDYKRAPKVVRGSRFERTGGDVAWSLWIAAWWPGWLTVVVLRATLRTLGAGVKTAVIRATPLTGPELERRLKEQQAEIARLTKEIGGTR